jgi:hypothetical protein
MTRTIKPKTLVRIVGGAGLALLTAVTCLKDNVHFGSTQIRGNVSKNQYAWGLYPNLRVYGKEVKGNLYSIGLIGGRVAIKNTNAVHEGNSFASGVLFGVNANAAGSLHVGDSRAYSVGYAINAAENSRHIGDSLALGVISGINDNFGGKHAGNSFGIAALFGINSYRGKAEHYGNANAIGVLFGFNDYCLGGKHEKGKSNSKGLLSQTENGATLLGQTVVQGGRE